MPLTWHFRSISGNENVIVASRNKIFEYTTDGTFVGSIYINLMGLQHALHLEGDTFLICNAAAQHRVCIYVF